MLPPEVDEETVKQAHDGDASSLALALAEAKALSVDAPGRPGHRQRFNADRRRATLFEAARPRRCGAPSAGIFGQEMILSSAVALARDGVVEWSHVDSATLKVRALSPGFIDAYLDAEWPDVAYCVGVFRMEGRGVTLFDAVEGSHFTILGLPLLPLLGALRERGVMAA